MPGPSTPAAARSKVLADRLQRGRAPGSRRRPGSRPTSPPAGARLEDRLQVGRHGDGRVAGTGADRRQRGHLHGPGQPARPAGDHDLAGAELGRARAARAAARSARRCRSSPPPARPARRRESRSATTRSSPRVPLARRDPVPDLGRVEADRQVGLDRDALDLAARGIDPGGDVAGDHRRAAAVDRLDRRGGRLPRRALEAGAEDRVDDRPEPSSQASRSSGPPRARARAPRPRSPSRAGAARQPARRRRCCPCRRRSAPAPAAPARPPPRPAPSRPPPSAPPRRCPAPRSPSDRPPGSRRRRRAG